MCRRPLSIRYRRRNSARPPSRRRCSRWPRRQPHCRPHLWSIRPRPLPGPAPSCRHRCSRCRSATCRPKSIRWRRRIGRAAPCRCRRRSTPMPRSPRRRPERSRSVRYRSAPARNGCCRSATAMPIRRSASAAARSSSSRRSNCLRPMPAIRKPSRTAPVRPISWWRRNCWCSPTGRGTRSPPPSSVPTPITPMTASCRRSIVRT